MNKKYLQFWLRFGFFFVVFTVAFFLILFILTKNPAQDLRQLFIKMGILATASSLFFNISFGSNPSGSSIEP